MTETTKAMTDINVCLSCDDNYSVHAGVVIASILQNSKNDENIIIYILDGGISEQHKKEILSLKSIKNCDINFIQINEKDFEEYKKVCTHKYITIATYYRLKLATLLPNVDKIIYFDCDIVVNNSLKKLFNTDLENYLIAGVQDLKKKMVKENPTYVNAGMLIFNLDLIRKENIEKEFLKYTQQNFETIKCGDQTILNDVCKGKIKLLDSTWNVQSSNFTNRSSYTNNPKIIHFVSKNKPWSLKSFSYHKNLYFKYLQLTPWKLNSNELKQALKSTAWEYFKYRPLFLFRNRFYEALYKTYLQPFCYAKPIIKDNTFIVWEPCSKSHSEVVPGYVKYLLDLGYHVSVLVHSDRLKEGLFSRFKNENISFNKMTKKQILNYFKKDSLEDIEGVLVTTVGKLCDEIDFDQAYNYFPKTDKSQLFFVAHEAQHGLDNGSWKENLITLRQLNYKNGESIVVNPHYFGKVEIKEKNDITNFVMLGALKPNKKNDNTIIDAISELDKQGITNFKITVIGKGQIKYIPPNIRKYFVFKGRLPFYKMYDEIENADFILSAYDTDNPMHIRYNTTGTSGNFQLVYGFLKPIIIIRDFACINGFDDNNSILYDNNKAYYKAMIEAINLSKNDYQIMQNNLKNYQENLYQKSLNNLRSLIYAK